MFELCFVFWRRRDKTADVARESEASPFRVAASYEACSVAFSEASKQFSLPVPLFVELSRPRGRYLLLDVLVGAEVFAGVEVAEEEHWDDLRGTKHTAAVHEKTTAPRCECYPTMRAAT